MDRTRARISNASACIMAITLAACAQPNPPAYLRLGGPAPAIADAPSRCLLVSFWATWCPPCREETAELRRLAEEPPSDLRVVVVSHDDDMDAVEGFLQGPPDPTLHMRLDPGKRLAIAFGVDVLPTSILVVDGRLVARFQGARRWNARAVRRVLERLIREARNPKVDNEQARN